MLNVFVIELYSVPAVVEYLHMAFSFVDKEIVACVVPEESVLLGFPLLLTGAEISAGGATLLTFAKIKVCAVFPATSLATAVNVCNPFVNVVVFQETE